MNKMFIVGVLGLLLIGCIGFIYNIDENTKIENISPYDIRNRYDCEQIIDNEKYNNCISFYLKNVPYKLGDILVSTRV